MDSEPGAVEVQVLLPRQTQQQLQRHLRLPPLSEVLIHSYISCSVALAATGYVTAQGLQLCGVASATGANADDNTDAIT